MSPAGGIKIKIRFLKIHDYADYATFLSFVFLPPDKVQNVVKVHLNVTCRCSTQLLYCESVMQYARHLLHRPVYVQHSRVLRTNSWTLQSVEHKYAQHSRVLSNNIGICAQHLLNTCSTLAQHFYHIFSGTSSVEQVLSSVSSKYLLDTPECRAKHYFYMCSVPSIPEMCPEENYRSEMDKRARKIRYKTVQSWIWEKLPARLVPKQCCWV